MKRALLVLGALLVALGALLYGLASTESGLRWLAARAAARLPPGSNFGEIHGRARGPIEIAHARFVAAGVLVEIGHATIEWSPAALVHRRVHLRRVDASDVRVRRLGAKAAADGATRPLPVSVLIDALAIERLDVVSAPDAEPIRLDEVTLAAELDAAGIAVRSLRARGLGARAEGDLAFGPAKPFTARLVWHYAPAGLAPLEGELHAHAQGDAIAVEQTLAAPYGLAFTGVLEPREWRLRGRVTAQALALDALHASWPELSLAGTADIDATLDALGATLDAQLTLAGAEPADIAAELSADRERLTIVRANVQWGDLRAEAQGQASVHELLAGAEPAQVSLALDITALDLALPQLGTVHGAGRVEGSYAQHAITGQGRLDTPALTNGTWRLAAHGESRVLTIDALEVALASGSARAHGTLDWRASPSIELHGQVRDADPAILWPRAPGRLDADASFATQPSARSWSLALDTLSGTLSGQAVRGRGGVRYDAGAWRFDALELTAGDLRMTLSGEVAERAALRWTLDAPDLHAADPSWSGRVRGSGSIGGTRAEPVLEGEVAGERLSAFGFTTGAVRGRWNVDLSGRTPLALNLAADALVVGGRRFDSVRVEGNGPIGAHTLEVAIESANARAQLALAGGWDGREWRGRVARMEIEAPAVSRWTLTEPAALSLSPEHFELERACLHDETSTSCVHADWRAPSAWSARATLEDVPLAAFAPLLPPALDYVGRAAGELDLAGAGREVTAAEATLDFTPGKIAERDPPQNLLAWQRAQVQAHLVGDRVLVNAGVELEGAGQLTLEAALPSVEPWRMTNVPIEGRVAGVLQEIPLIAALLPDVSELRGETRLDLRVAGTLLQPAIFGTASFEHGAAELPRLGISLRDVALALRGDGRTLTLDVRARSGKGTLALAGTLEPGERGWQGQAKISGRDFVALELPGMHAEISPNVQLELDGRDVKVTGEVSLPRARIAPRDLTGTVRASSDAVIVGANPEDDTRSPWTVDARVRFALGTDVHFAGFGLDAQIGGSVLAADRPGAATTGSGELRVVAGTYTAYGRELVLDRGRLLFTGGPIDNPALDARASRRVEQQTVGVDARGTLRKPELKLFSDPALSQSDALAYLLTGRPVSGLSGGEQIQLADTTRQIGLSGAGFLASQVGRRIGLDEAGIENAGDTARASFFVGKYLSPKLYLGYGLGLFESFNTLRVRYAFTPQLSLQAESGTEHSADVLYSIER